MLVPAPLRPVAGVAGRRLSRSFEHRYRRHSGWRPLIRPACRRTASRLSPADSSAAAATPPASMRPSGMCSVPTRSLLPALASCCARTTARRAWSVNRLCTCPPTCQRRLAVAGTYHRARGNGKTHRESSKLIALMLLRAWQVRPVGHPRQRRIPAAREKDRQRRCLAGCLRGRVACRRQGQGAGRHRCGGYDAKIARERVCSLFARMPRYGQAQPGIRRQPNRRMRVQYGINRHREH